MTSGDETWRETIAFLVYRSVAWLARALPEDVGRRLFRLGGRLAFELAPGTRAVVARNQAQVLGRAPSDRIVRDATREAFDAYARYWFDSFRFAVMPPDEGASRFESVDAEWIHPEMVCPFGVPRGDMARDAFVKAEFGEEPKRGGHPLLAV